MKVADTNHLDMRINWPNRHT